jgi:LEA14-like dessication related protein
MRITITSFILLVCFGFVSCKKKEENQLTKLDLYTKELKIIPIRVLGNEMIMSFVENSGQSDIKAKFQMKMASETNWRDVPFTNKNNILVSDLKPNTTYYFRVALSKGAELRYSTIDSEKTKNYYLNYKRFFEGPTNTHDGENGIFSIEGAKHFIYGGGFSNETNIKITFASIDNLSSGFSLNATIINDSSISFEIPRNTIENQPYKRNSIFSCMVGELPLIGYKSYLEQNYLVKGDMSIVNRDIYIGSFTADGFSCKTLNLYGYFGIHESETVCPESLYNISMRLKSRKIIINDMSGAKVHEAFLTPIGSLATSCNMDGLTVADEVALSQKMIYYHEVSKITLRTNIAPGSYKAYIREIAKDESVILSNEININF